MQVHVTQEGVQLARPGLPEEPDSDSGYALDGGDQHLGATKGELEVKCCEGSKPARRHRQAAVVGEEGCSAGRSMLRTRHTWATTWRYLPLGELSNSPPL